MKNKKRYCGFLIISLLGFVFVQSANNTFATNVEDEVTITIPESCSLTGSVGTAHAADIENGVYTNDVGETTISAFCNDSEGFSIYAVGFTNNEFGNNTMKPITLSNDYAIATGLATSGDASNWAMKLTSLSDGFALTSGYNSYHAVPNELTKVASYPSNTTTSAGVQIKSTYAAYVSGVQPADSYTGKVKYIVMHPASKIATTNISDLTYMQDFRDLSSDEKMSVAMSMQDRTVYNLVDNRDNRTYQIAKLKDGNIWMAENLDLGRTPLTNDLTSENSNLASTITAATFNSWKTTNIGYGFDNGRYMLLDGTDQGSGTPYATLYDYYALTGGTVSGSSFNGIAEYDICPAGWRLPDGVDHREHKTLYSYYNSAQLIRAPIADGGAAFALSGVASGSAYGSESQGYYWTTSNTGWSNMKIFDVRTSTVSFSGYERDHGASARCIAKNPIYSFTVSYGAGVASVTVNGVEAENGATFSGERSSRYTIGIIPEARYALDKWSSTSGTIEEPRNDYTTFTLGGADAVLSVSVVHVDTEMQNLASSSCTDDPLRVYDNRDGRTYTVKRLLDGNCWMIEGLNLGKTALTTNLTSTNTNISSTITSSTFNSWKKSSSSNTYDDGVYIIKEGGDARAGVAYGISYNYYAASGGTISGSSNTNDASYDICPAGWRLPTGGDYGEYKVLNNYSPIELLVTSIFKNGAGFAIAPNPNNITFVSGSYWSSTTKGEIYMYMASLDYSLFSYELTYYPVSYISRRELGFVRCVLKKPTQSITVSYGAGVSEVTINKNLVADGAVITGEQGTQFEISMVPDTRYAINSWSASSGTIEKPGLQTTIYTLGTSDATLSVSAAYVNTEIQNLASSSCTATPTHVYDNRDDHIYTVQRLLDGKCWMMENLDLGRTTLTNDLSSSNTNLDATITASTFNSWKKTSSSRTYTSGEFFLVDGAYSNNGMPYGILYNYYATSAGTISGSNSNDATYDICPAGWRLPTGGDSGEFKTLYNNYNSFNRLTASFADGGANFVLAGNVYNRPSGVGSEGDYWSSTSYNSTSRRVLSIGSSYISTTSYNGNYYGCSVRCVLK